MKAWALTVFMSATLISCGGDDDDDKKTADAVSYGSLKSSLLASETVSSYNLTQATCTSDSNSGLLTASFSGDSGSKLEIRVKGFSTDDTTYTCAQSSDNVDGDVGQRYNGCMVEITVPDASTSVNSYAMHRSADTIKDFTYTGICTVTTEYAAPKVTFSVNCAGLIQTIYQGAARNPIDTAVTAKVNNATSANCTI